MERVIYLLKNQRALLSSFLSFIIVAFGQPGWLPWLGPVAAACGFALFWYGVRGSGRFYKAAIWFAAVQLVQLSWMTSIEYQGVYILVVYLLLALALGLQFGLLTLLIPKDRGMRFLEMLTVASLWTLMEWVRFYFLCGLSFNLVGISLTSYLPSLQLASVWGVLGLSFWVMLTNAALYSFVRGRVRKTAILSLGFLSFPYLFGIAHLAYHAHMPGEELSVALVQTGLLPSEKIPMGGRAKDFLSPWEQWRRILRLLKEEGKEKFDLIVLPEAALPFLAKEPLYPIEDAVKMLQRELGAELFPPLHPPYAEKKEIAGKERWLVSNLFWAQTIAAHFDAEVVIGLDDRETVLKENYNAAFHLLPSRLSCERYEKQILLPLAEYLPFNWCLPYVKKYGIAEFFTKGEESKVFQGARPIALSICYEETFPHLMRLSRMKGASLFINLTNDNYYPFSRLPQQHFDHARLRTVENGVPLVRSCNTGITAAIDSLGRVKGKLGELDENNKLQMGLVALPLSLYHYKTLYTYWGDGCLITLCFLSLAFSFLFKIKRSDKFLKN